MRLVCCNCRYRKRRCLGYTTEQVRVSTGKILQHLRGVRCHFRPIVNFGGSSRVISRSRCYGLRLLKRDSSRGRGCLAFFTSARDSFRSESKPAHGSPAKHYDTNAASLTSCANDRGHARQTTGRSARGKKRDITRCLQQRPGHRHHTAVRRSFSGSAFYQKKRRPQPPV